MSDFGNGWSKQVGSMDGKPKKGGKKRRPATGSDAAWRDFAKSNSKRSSSSNSSELSGKSAYTKLVPSSRNEYNVTPAYRRSLRRDLVKRLGGKCNRCGSVENLEIDHIDSSRKRTSDFAYLEAFALMAELRNCQLLCKPCHGDKSREHGDYRALQCGTYRKYIDKGCRCAACYTAYERHKHNEASRISKLKSGIPTGKPKKGRARRKKNPSQGGLGNDF